MVATGVNTRLVAITSANAAPAMRSRRSMAPFARNMPTPTRTRAEIVRAGRFACVVMPGKVPMQNRSATASGLRARPVLHASDASPACVPLPPRSDSAVGMSTTMPTPTASTMVAAKRQQRRRRRPRRLRLRASS